MNSLHRISICGLLAAASFWGLSIGSAGASAAIWCGPTDGSWNAGANWTPTGVPGAADVAQFDSASGTIALDASQTIGTLIFNTTDTTTIGSAGDNTSGYTLTLNNVTRNDVSGTEHPHTIAASVTLAANSTWTVEGSAYLQVTGSIGDGGNAYSLTKNGSGELRLGANTYTGATIINAGTIRSTANGTIKGNLIIGDGVSAAAYYGGSSSISSDITNASNVTVNQNGLLYLAANSGEHIRNLTVNGGTTRFKYTRIDGSSISMTGGTIAPVDQWSGALYLSASISITTNASNSTALISIPLNLYAGGPTQFIVADGAAPIDLKIAAGFVAGSSSQTLGKSGSGVMQLTGNTGAIASNGGSSMSDKVAVTGGTLLVDNTAGSGTGQSAVSVSGGATLGGTGFIGGVSGYSNANVTLTGANASSLATLAPGTIDETTGDHIIGTLAVGGTAQSNNVTFGNYSQLAIQLAGDNIDVLAVTGSLNLGTLLDKVSINIAGSQTLSRYVFATYTGSLTGMFDSSSIVGATGASIDYSVNGQIALVLAVVPEPASAALLIIGGIGVLARRNRRIR